MRPSEIRLIATIFACVIVALVGLTWFILWLCSSDGRFVIHTPTRDFTAVHIVMASENRMTYRAADGTEGSVYGTFTVEKLPDVEASK